MAAGIAVLAAAPGTILRTRDGMADVSIRVSGADAVKGRDAGNSIVIGHGADWETQYAHLRLNGIAVQPGDSVVAGQRTATMGMSGNVAFTHLHFEVRHDGETVDPYAAPTADEACPAVGASLWSPAAEAALAYREDAPFDAGFAAERPDPWAARACVYAAAVVAVDSPALVFWIDVIGHRKGDRQAMRLIGPDGTTLAETADSVEDTRIQWFQFVGKKRPPAGWPRGRYRGEYVLTRDIEGQALPVVIISHSVELR
jgi:hypothetical protein